MDEQSQINSFNAHLLAHATSYYTDLGSGPVDVQLAGVEPRTASVLYRYELHGNGARHPVLVKVPLLRRESGDTARANGRAVERPRLVSLTPAGEKVRLEYLALAEIQQYFYALGDPRFGAIRVHDYLPEHHALVMQESSDTSMTSLLSREHSLRLGRPEPRLDRVFRHSGAWLRAYHELPKARDVETRHATRGEFIAAVEAYTGFLANTTGASSRFERMARQVRQLAEAVLPDMLPMGLAHGDYTTRNILVGEGDRVTVIDTLAKWRAPIYEDIAYFLVQFKTNKLQSLTQGLAFGRERLARYEAAFLDGYFGGEPVPHEAIQLFELLLLLDKWSSYPGRFSGGLSMRRLRARVLARLSARYLEKSSSRLLAQLNSQSNVLAKQF